MRDNWLSNAPLDDWWGVRTDDNGRVIQLGILLNNLRGTIPPEIGNLTKLEVLSLGNNHLSGVIPQELGRLTNLRTVYLGYPRSPIDSTIYNQFTGCVPDELRYLRHDDFYKQGLSFCGTPAISNEDRDALVALYQTTGGPDWRNSENWLSRTKSLGEWYGVTTDLNGRVIKLDLESNRLNGEIPPELGSLSSLRVLNLKFHKLIGNIPSELSNLSNLEYLNLTGDIFGEFGFTGKIPPELGGLSNLKELHLPYNRLTGEVPSELGNLSALEDLDLSDNELIGEIPPELGNLTALEDLDLSQNNLIGEIPKELGNLSNLRLLILRFNRLSGEIPASLGNIANLEVLNIELNRLTGQVPHVLGELPKLRYLQFSNGNRFTGCIPKKLLDVEAHDLAELRLPSC